MRRRQFPPYGAALMDRRRRGDHPLCVHLIYGYKWRAEVECWWAPIVAGMHPVLAVKPSEYEPGRYDWSLVTGLQVCVFDQDGAASPWVDLNDGPPPQWWHARLYALIGELAQFAADVEIYSPLAFGKERWSAHELARQATAKNRGQRPHWWSAETQQNNAERIRTWTRIVFGEQLAEPAAA